MAFLPGNMFCSAPPEVTTVGGGDPQMGFARCGERTLSWSASISSAVEPRKIEFKPLEGWDEVWRAFPSSVGKAPSRPTLRLERVGLILGGCGKIDLRTKGRTSPEEFRRFPTLGSSILVVRPAVGEVVAG